MSSPIKTFATILFFIYLVTSLAASTRNFYYSLVMLNSILDLQVTKPNLVNLDLAHTMYMAVTPIKRPKGLPLGFSKIVELIGSSSLCKKLEHSS